MGLHVNCENIDGSVVINDFISVFPWFFSLLHAEKKISLLLSQVFSLEKTNEDLIVLQHGKSNSKKL